MALGELIFRILATLLSMQVMQFLSIFRDFGVCPSCVNAIGICAMGVFEKFHFYVGCFGAAFASGVNFNKSADKTHAPASFVVHTEIGWPFAAIGSLSFKLIDVSATHTAWVRTRTSNAVSMRCAAVPVRCTNVDDGICC